MLRQESAEFDERSQVVPQEIYRHGNDELPAVQPVLFYAPLRQAKVGDVEDHSSVAFDGPFADDSKKKFQSRLLVSL